LSRGRITGAAAGSFLRIREVIFFSFGPQEAMIMINNNGRASLAGFIGLLKIKWQN
jgi:hypothetical protein